MQHPPPALKVDVARSSAGILVSAPHAYSVLDGAPAQPFAPPTMIWVLLYAQAAQVDGRDRRNVLLARKPGASVRGNDAKVHFSTAGFQQKVDVDTALRECTKNGRGNCIAELSLTGRNSC